MVNLINRIKYIDYTAEFSFTFFHSGGSIINCINAVNSLAKQNSPFTLSSADSFCFIAQVFKDCHDLITVITLDDNGAVFFRAADT